jgi:arabinogalactan oligomer/maltooligosaccharide transport system permease protein
VAPAKDAPPRKPFNSYARTWSPGFIVKLVIMALVTAGCVYGLFAAIFAKSYVIAAVSVVIGAVTLYVYFSNKTIPAKYLLPGITMLLIFQIYVMGYTVFVSFTNQGGSHSATKAEAIENLQLQNLLAVEGGQSYVYTAFERGGTYYLAIVKDGQAMVGTTGEPFEAVDDATVDGQRVTAIDGYTSVSSADPAISTALNDLSVPLTDDIDDGVLKVAGMTQARTYRANLTYDEANDTMTNLTTGVVYVDNGRGYFVDSSQPNCAASTCRLATGWWVGVGFSNYVQLFTDSKMSKAFLGCLWWTFAFAFLSVATTFFFGLILALAFNTDKLKGQKIYRLLMILPYAFPGFMTPLIWKAMLNTDFGFINKVIFGGAHIGWLDGGPWIAKLSILMVNLWLGYPYMFLVTTGALQAIPGDIMESAKMDGANAFQTFRQITLPLVFVATAPLLISSFAFNFNNFSLIYMLTGGGPYPTSDPNVPGQTDILVTMVYRVSGLDGNGSQNYGLATALSLIIFILVGLISIYSFRKTRSLEDMG